MLGCDLRPYVDRFLSETAVEAAAVLRARRALGRHLRRHLCGGRGTRHAAGILSVIWLVLCALPMLALLFHRVPSPFSWLWPAGALVLAPASLWFASRCGNSEPISSLGELSDVVVL